MRFEFIEEPSVPRLAWSARLVKRHPTVVVRHGPWVEARDVFFFEGAWDDECGAGRFAEASTFSGSGAALTGNGVLFSTSTHTLDRLHLIRLDDSIVVSNSLAWLFEEAGDAPDPAYWFYDADLISITAGLKRHRATIGTARGNTIRLYYHCNVLIDSALATTKLAKRVREPFGSYRDYAGFLRNSVVAVQRNATSTERKIRYAPLATVSSGYDSPACAALAREAGCGEAVTLTTCRAEFGTTDDTGGLVARHLGLRVGEFDRLAYRGRRGFPEAEFLAWGTGGEDVVMSALEDVLPARLLYTGFHGDMVWDRESPHVGPDIERGDPSGASLAEFRLRVGFVNLPVPFIGCTQHASIHAISNGAEMRPWSVGGGYDRPIPRRIAEEAGVPRYLFGQQKKATTQPFLRRTDELEAIMTPESHRDFLDLLGAVPRRRRVWRAVVAALSRRWGLRWGLPLLVAPNFSEGPVWKGLTFHWAVGHLRGRYAPTRGGEAAAAVPISDAADPAARSRTTG